MSTLEKLQDVIADFFKINSEVISGNTTAENIADWDSFSHMELMSFIEDKFLIKIPFSEIMEFKCVGDIAIYLEKNKN